MKLVVALVALARADLAARCLPSFEALLKNVHLGSLALADCAHIPLGARGASHLPAVHVPQGRLA